MFPFSSHDLQWPEAELKELCLNLGFLRAGRLRGDQGHSQALCTSSYFGNKHHLSIHGLKALGVLHLKRILGDKYIKYHAKSSVFLIPKWQFYRLL